jgi:hypothetical protein
MGIDEKKAKIYDVIGNLIMKFLFAISALIAFFIILSFYISSKTQFDAVKYGAIETLLGGSVFVAFRHFFPSKRK